MQDLTGTWSCTDGGTYYIQQIGTVVHWRGDGSGWKNAGYGVIDSDRQEVIVTWADTPDSDNAGNQGLVFLDASETGTLSKTTGRGTGTFTKQ